jgi:hydrogenase-1 operon protein HyaF
MRDFSFLNDDLLVDALIMEVGGLLRRLIDHGETGSIDLLGLPLSPSCIASLEQRLGRGEVTAQLDAAGLSDIRETRFPGVWWSRHRNEAGRIIGMLIEVTFVPEILRADADDVARGYQSLGACTHAATYTQGLKGAA